MTSETLLQGRIKSLWLIAAVGVGTTFGLLATRVSTPKFVLVGVVGLLAAAVIVAVPEIGLLTVAFSTYLNLSVVLARHFGAALSLMQFLVPLVVLAVLVHGLWRRKPPTGWLVPTLLVATYGFAGVLSLFATSDPSTTLQGITKLVKDGLVAILVVVLIRHAATLRRMLWTLLAAGLLMGIISVHQHLTGNFASDYWGLASQPGHYSTQAGTAYRVVGPVGDPNRFGLIMLVLVPLAIDRIVGSRRLAARALAVVTLLVCSLSIVFTYSRGSFVALLAMLVFLLVVYRPRLRHVLAAIGVAALLLPIVPQTYFQRMGTLIGVVRQPTIDVGVHDNSIRGRFSENLVAIRMFLDHPLVGIGFANYPARYQDYSQQLMIDPRSEERSAHNLYLEIAAETGIIGVAAFGLILWVLLKRILVARSSLRDSELAEVRGMVDAVAIGLFGFLVGSLFLHAAYMRYFWLLAGIALALPRVAASEVAALRQVDSHDSRSD